MEESQKAVIHEMYDQRVVENPPWWKKKIDLLEV
jgi:hypothetical protein